MQKANNIAVAYCHPGYDLTGEELNSILIYGSNIYSLVTNSYFCMTAA